MDVTGIGVDILEISRMRAILMRTPRFRYRVFTEDERAWCEKRADPAASYAGCFAAREAVLKALGCGFDAGVGYADVSVTHSPQGRPQALLRGRALELARSQGVTSVFISISHTRDVAVANAVATTQNSAPPADPEEVRKSSKEILEGQFKEARRFLDDLGPAARKDPARPGNAPAPGAQPDAKPASSARPDNVPVYSPEKEH